jgi:hypothetical protein
MPVVIDSFDVVPDTSAPPPAEAGAPTSAPHPEPDRTRDVERALAHERRRHARLRAH